MTFTIFIVSVIVFSIAILVIVDSIVLYKVTQNPYVPIDSLVHPDMRIRERTFSQQRVLATIKARWILSAITLCISVPFIIVGLHLMGQGKL